MNANAQVLKPAAELARADPVRIPNESAEYRAARTALLAEEIELRRHIERVAAQRRALPPGGPVIGDYRFEGEDGPTDFAGLFGDKQTLAIYSYMFGPERERPCPMCTNTLGRLGGQCGRHRPADLACRRRALADRAPDRLEKRARLAQPSPLQRSQRRLFARLFRHPAQRLRSPGLQRVHPPRRDDPPFLVRRDDELRPPTPARTRAARPTRRRLWMVLDCTPEGRGADWYPKLEYA